MRQQKNTGMDGTKLFLVIAVSSPQYQQVELSFSNHVVPNVQSFHALPGYFAPTATDPTPLPYDHDLFETPAIEQTAFDSGASHKPHQLQTTLQLHPAQKLTRTLLT